MAEESSKLSTLLNKVNLRDVIAQETQQRLEDAAEHLFEPIKNNDDFHEEEEIEEEEIEEIEEYDAEKNAKSLVYGLQTLDAIILNPIAMIKVRHRAGGGKVMKKMRAAYLKKMNGETLTENDTNLIQALDEYEKKMRLLSDDFLPSERETQEMIKMAIPYCEANQIEFGPGLAFWGMYASNTIGKITKILMT